MIRNTRTIINLYSTDLIIQKYNIEDKTLYCKNKNGLEEWYKFHSVDKLSDNTIVGYIETYKNSSGFECKFTYSCDNCDIIYDDNLGNHYEDYHLDKLERKYDNGLEYRLDDNGNIVYYQTVDGYVDEYEYDSNNLITKYTRKSEDGTYFHEIKYRRDYENKRTYSHECKCIKDEYYMVSIRVYDEYGREISYVDDSGIESETSYDGNVATVKVYSFGEKINEYTNNI